MRNSKGGKTSSVVKDRYNKKNYDTILLRIPIGEKEKIRKKAEQDGKSINAYIKNKIEVT